MGEAKHFVALFTQSVRAQDGLEPRILRTLANFQRVQSTTTIDVSNAVAPLLVAIPEHRENFLLSCIVTRAVILP